MDKLVLYKEFSRYCITSEENYHAFIRNENASTMIKFPYDMDKQSVLETISRYNICKPEELIDKTGE